MSGKDDCTWGAYGRVLAGVQVSQAERAEFAKHPVLLRSTNAYMPKCISRISKPRIPTTFDAQRPLHGVGASGVT